MNRRKKLFQEIYCYEIYIIFVMIYYKLLELRAIDERE